MVKVNPWTLNGNGAGHAPVNNKAHIDGPQVSAASSAGKTSNSPGGKKDGAPPRRGGGAPGMLGQAKGGWSRPSGHRKVHGS